MTCRFSIRFIIHVFVLAALTVLAGSFAQAGEIQAGGGASDDFQLDPALTINNPNFLIGAVLERDRMYMAARPGWQNKHVPFTFDQNGLPYSGGVYLFDTEEDAAEFSQWLGNEFVLDGVLILDRPYFINPLGYFYKVIGAHEFDNSHGPKVVLRTERWLVPDQGPVELFLRALWPVIRLEARKRGYTEVWLLYNKEEHLVNLVYFDDRVGPENPQELDFATLTSLASAPSLGKAFDLLQWPKVFNRTSFIFAIWAPFEEGDSGEPTVWPNSPPLPQDFSGDGLCVPSHGEDYLNSPADCLPTCGDGVTQAGETTANCPSDVPLE